MSVTRVMIVSPEEDDFRYAAEMGSKARHLATALTQTQDLPFTQAVAGFRQTAIEASAYLVVHRAKTHTIRRLFSLEVEGKSLYEARWDLNWCLSMPRVRIFVSSVERGIPSFAAAPDGPATRPRLSRRAASIRSFSRLLSNRVRLWWAS